MEKHPPSPGEKAYLQALYNDQVKTLQLMLRYYSTAKMTERDHKHYRGKIARHREIMESTLKQLHNIPLP
jgi:hypothetical protein